MKRIHINLFWFGFIFFLAASASAQFNLSGLYTQTVKQGQGWASINTVVDEVKLDITVNRGIVTTTMQVALTPGVGYVRENFSEPLLRDGKTQYPVQYTEKKFDSLETRAGFNLEANTAITNMFLWVGEQKVRAYLQERSLATAQYESIVQRRRDPCLLSTWGNGYYDIRIFPLESGQTRQFELQFVQGLENGPQGYAGSLPITYSESRLHIPNMIKPEEGLLKLIGNLHITARSLDGRTYRLNWEGIGDMKIGPAPLTMDKQNVEKLGNGTVSASRVAGALPAWLGARDLDSYFGVMSRLVYNDLLLEEEPSERIFLLDVSGEKDVDRARKLALMAVKSYVAEGQTFDLVFREPDGKLSSLFGKAQAFNSQTLNKAFQGILNWRGSSKSSSTNVLEDFAAVRIPDRKTVVLLISSQIAESYSVQRPRKTGDREFDRLLNEEWRKGYNAWQQQLNDRIKALSEAFNNKNLMLFGFWRDYRLSQTAGATGGFQLGSLSPFYYWYRPYPVAVEKADTVSLPKTPVYEWYMPPLFGPGRPGGSGVQNLQVTTSGTVVVSDLAVVTGYRNPYYYPGMNRGGIVVDGGVPELMNSVAMPYYYRGSDSVKVRISGRYSAPGLLKITIKGTWNGLAFTKSEAVSLASGIGGSPLASSLWAYQKSENLLAEDYQGSVAKIQDLGKTFHIVNSQMSLLALEPGMDLWNELPNDPSGQQGGENEAASPADKVAMVLVGSSRGDTGSSVSLDDMTLEEILNTTAIDLPGAVRETRMEPGFDISTGAMIRFAVSGAAGARGLEIQITDLRGRTLARVRGSFEGNIYRAAWTPGKSLKGVFVARVRVSGKTLVRRFVIP